MSILTIISAFIMPHNINELTEMTIMKSALDNLNSLRSILRENGISTIEQNDFIIFLPYAYVLVLLKYVVFSLKYGVRMYLIEELNLKCQRMLDKLERNEIDIN
jgi:hypothetical protein